MFVYLFSGACAGLAGVFLASGYGAGQPLEGLGWELAAIASESGAFLMEAMWMKFNPLYLRLREIVDAGAIGEIRSVRSSFGAPFPRDDSSRWKPGGSALLDQGTWHVLEDGLEP